jgi:hypothetical protein
MQFEKLKKKSKDKKLFNFFLDDQMKETFFINVLPLYTKSHTNKYLNHLETCKMPQSILAIAN